MFDINHGNKVKEREETGIVLPFKNELGEVEEGVSMVIVGSYSDTYNKNIKAYRAKNLEEKKEVSDEEAHIAVAACSIKSWEGFVSGGEPFPHSLDNAIALLTACEWTHDEIRGKAFDRKAFFTKPSDNS